VNLGSVETLTTDTWPQVIVPIQFYEFLSVPHIAMETNTVTSSGNSSIPTIVSPTGESSPNLPSSVQATMVSATTTSDSVPTPSMAVATTPFTPSATDPPFSYGMPSTGTSPTLTYSTLQTLGLGAGSSNAPLQGQLRGTPIPFNTFPYAGGHITPSSPLLGGLHQQSIEQPAQTNLFGARSQGTPTHNMPVGSSPFVWNGTFGNNTFTSTSFPSGSTPTFGQSTPAQGIISMSGAHIADLGTQDKDPFPPLERRFGVILSIVNGTLDRLLCLSHQDQHGVILPKVLQT
jgi:hypothetical protein